jgi:hypothetical protein
MWVQAPNEFVLHNSMTPKVARSNRSEIVYRILLVIGSIALGLCVLELLAWFEVFDYRVLLGSPASLETDIADRELLHRHTPYLHLSGTFRGGQITGGFQIPPAERLLYRWEVQYDRNGFRNKSDLSQADVVVIGDSIVEGMTVPYAQIMTSLLADMQKQTVANFGQPGYGPLEEIGVLKRYGLPLQPHTVIWMFYEANDLRDVIHYRNAIAARDDPKPDAGPKRSGIRRMISELHYRLDATLRRATRPPGVRRAGLVRTAEGQRLNEYFEYPSHPFSADDISALDETARVIENAERLCAAQGARFLFVFIPAKFRAFRDSCEFPAKSECRTWILTDLPERLRHAVGPVSASVGYRDLTSDMVAAVKRGDFPYYSDDDHWSPVGHRIAAEAIHRYLQKMPNPCRLGFCAVEIGRDREAISNGQVTQAASGSR